MTKRLEMSDGNQIPILGLGTWQLRGRKCVSATKEALEIGYDHIDTADAYGNHARIRKGIQDADREKLFITTKIPKRRIKRPVKNVKRYLDELGVEYLDLVLLHWPKSSAPMAESLLEIQEMSSVKSVGASNFTIEHLQDVIAKGFKPVINQVEFHPYLYQKELLEYCAQHDILITAYSPLARGKVIDDPVLTEIADRHDASAVQISLAWIMSKNVVAIPKASSREHLEENFASLEIELSEDEIAQIDAVEREKRLVNPLFSEF